jgi:hypothetical protein
VILECIISSFIFFVISIFLLCIIYYGMPRAYAHPSLGSTANVFSQVLLKTIIQTDTLTFLLKRASVCLTLLNCSNCYRLPLLTTMSVFCHWFYQICCSLLLCIQNGFSYYLHKIRITKFSWYTIMERQFEICTARLVIKGAIVG